MRLFHGTSTKKLDSIFKHGLRPRGRKKSLWTEYPSAPDRVYLTKAYALFFGSMAASEDGSEGAVLEVSGIDMSNLVPDEDALAQINITDMPELADMDLNQRTAFWRKNAPKHSFLTHDSLRLLGNCAHMGTILSTEIEKCVTFDPVEVTLVCDPTITPMNYHILGERYERVLANFIDNGGGTLKELMHWWNLDHQPAETVAKSA
tara:strand:- start:561 stop:1175 length:615 start_codon:yes stop_codon:yes gene_type:complete